MCSRGPLCLCIVVGVDGGVQQGTSVCGSVLFNVGNLVIKSETVFQNSSPPQFWKKVSRRPWNWTFGLCILDACCTPSSMQIVGGFHKFVES